MTKTNRQRNTTSSYRQMIFERRRVKFFDCRNKIISSGKETRENSFTFLNKIVYPYTENQTMEAKFKRNRAYRQNTARLTRQLDRLAHFGISIKYKAGKNF